MRSPAFVQVEQRSAEWEQLRLGIPTSSEFDKLISAKTAKPSAQSVAYERKLLVEWLLGHPVGPDLSNIPAIAAGNEREPAALAAFEFETGLETSPGGMIFYDDERDIGCSPDRLVGKDSALEIKCPYPETHLDYLLTPGLPAKYRAQVQGSLWIADFARWHFVSYCPELPIPLVHRVIVRDEDYITALAAIARKFVADMAGARELLKSTYGELAGE